MPAIPLEDDFLDGPNRDATRVMLAATMLFPDDAAAAAQWGRATYMAACIADLRAHGSDLPATSDISGLMELASQAGVSSPLTEMPRFYLGLLIASIVGQKIARPDESLQAIKATEIERLLPELRQKREAGKPSTFDEIQRQYLKPFDRTTWRILRPVAHLWLAFCPYFDRREFPCPDGCLEDFLLNAERALVSVLRTRSRRSGEPLVSETEVWRLAPRHLSILLARQPVNHT